MYLAPLSNQEYMSKYLIGPRENLLILVFNIYYMKLIPNDIIIPIDQYISQSLLEKLLLAVVGDLTQTYNWSQCWE